MSLLLVEDHSLSSKTVKYPVYEVLRHSEEKAVNLILQEKKKEGLPWRTGRGFARNEMDMRSRQAEENERPWLSVKVEDDFKNNLKECGQRQPETGEVNYKWS